jgi:hypothetical protein
MRYMLKGYSREEEGNAWSSSNYKVAVFNNRQPGSNEVYGVRERMIPSLRRLTIKCDETNSQASGQHGGGAVRMLPASAIW